jgi:cytochrome c peroxidase
VSVPQVLAGHRWWCSIVLLLSCICSANTGPAAWTETDWTAAEREILKSLWIENLPALPDSPGNPVADNPRAAKLGHRIFFDTAFSRDGAVSCATCHQPDLNFSGGLIPGRDVVLTPRRTMSIVGAAYSPWLTWDGRSDSLWAQALEPLENSLEHGGTRAQYFHMIASDPSLRTPYESLFGLLPPINEVAHIPKNASPIGDPEVISAWNTLSATDKALVNTVFSNIGRVLEAYQRLLIPGASRFDHYLQAVTGAPGLTSENKLTNDEVAGLRLFIGKGNCVHCHNGPLLTNNEFHNTGLFPPNTLPKDRGRVEGVKLLLASEFNCLNTSQSPENCDELRFVKKHGLELVAAFRTPSLRTINKGPFMHAGQFQSMMEVIDHYNTARATLISDDLEPLQLTDIEKTQLIKFLGTVTSQPAAEEKWLSAPLNPVH